MLTWVGLNHAQLYMPILHSYNTSYLQKKILTVSKIL